MDRLDLFSLGNCGLPADPMEVYKTKKVLDRVDSQSLLAWGRGGHRFKVSGKKLKGELRDKVFLGVE